MLVENLYYCSDLLENQEMKKLNICIVFVLLVLVVSFFVYIFFNVVFYQLSIGEDVVIEELDYEDCIELEFGFVVLFDVCLIKKVFEVGKCFLLVS